MGRCSPSVSVPSGGASKNCPGLPAFNWKCWAALLMNRLSWVILVFAIGFAAVHLVPLLVWKPWPANSLIGVGTALDLLSPLIMLPIYMLLYQWGHNRKLVQPSMWLGLAFLVFAVLWVEGDGLHIQANAISLALKAASISGQLYAVT